MGSVLGVIPIVVRRLAANGRLMAAVVVGAVLAAALMSTTSIYTDAIRDLGLSYAIKTRGVDKINVAVNSTSQSSVEDTYRKNDEFVQSTAKRTIGPLIRGPVTSIGRSATFFPTPPGQAVATDEGRARANLQFVSGIESHVRLTAGRMPASAPFVEGRAPAVEAALGSATAQRVGIKAGDRIDLHPFWAPDSEPVHVTVVGIVEPVDAGEAFWVGERDLFDFRTEKWDTLRLFVTQDSYFKAVAPYLPTMISDYTDLIYLSTKPINARNAASVRSSMLAFGQQLAQNLPRTVPQTELPDVLQSFDQKLFFTRIPLLVLVLQIAGIVVYYLFMVSTMLIERQTGEISLLKSRGATTRQIMLIYAMEGLAVLIIAMAIGPPLAAVVIALLGQTPPFADLSGGANLRVHLTDAAYAWAGAGALLAYAALLVPAYLATKRTVVQQRAASSRPPKEAPFTRYYLDLALVGVAAVLFYQLHRRSGLVTHKIFGDQSVDPILLLTPTFFILTVGIVFLRLFPLALKCLAWLMARAQGTTVLIGTWQMVRNPTHYSRLVLLLMLATAVGMFAASFGATVQRSYRDRAAYQAGAALRLAELRTTSAPGPNSLAATAGEQTGAQVASPVLRLGGSQGPLFNRVNFDLMGIEPRSFVDAAYFRDDFAGGSAAALVAPLEADSILPKEIELAPDARWLGVWLNPIDLKGRVGLQARLQDATGRYFVFDLGPEGGSELEPGWSFLVADLSKPGLMGGSIFTTAPPVSPFRLVALSIRFLSRVSAPSGAVQIDELQSTPETALAGRLGTERLLHDASRAAQPFAQRQTISSFDSVTEWQPIQGMTAEPLKDEVRQTRSAGETALELQWRPVQGVPITHGIRPRGEEPPLAVLASTGFLKATGLKVGDSAQLFVSGSYVQVKLAGTYRLFPTLDDPRKNASLVANGTRLQALIDARPESTPTYANEVWLNAPPEGAAKARDAIGRRELGATVVSFAELRTAQQNDPLIAAGWQGILFLSFAAILLLSAIGFLIYSYLTAQKRTLEFAVLRTMGFSKRQIAGVVGFEQAFVVGLGMIAGTLMGLRLGSLMIGYMGVTETGSAVLPPMLLHVSWLTLVSTWLVMGLVFLVTIGIVVVMYSRLALHRVLRIGET